jgi:hypothetical protein
MRALKLLADCHPKKRAPLLRCCRGAGTCAHSAAVGGGPLMAIKLAAPSEPTSLTMTSPVQRGEGGRVQGMGLCGQHTLHVGLEHVQGMDTNSRALLVRHLQGKGAVTRHSLPLPLGLACDHITLAAYAEALGGARLQRPPPPFPPSRHISAFFPTQPCPQHTCLCHHSVAICHRPLPSKASAMASTAASVRPACAGLVPDMPGGCPRLAITLPPGPRR